MSYYLFDESPYLIHHGVKGMRWGVRRDRAHSRGSKKPLTAAQKAERKRKLIKGAKIAAAALGTAAVVGGTAYARKKRIDTNTARRREEARQREERAYRAMANIERIMLRPIGSSNRPGSYMTIRGEVEPPANMTLDDMYTLTRMRR